MMEEHHEPNADSHVPGSVEALEEMLSRPGERLIERLGLLDGDILFLGVGGKMGPTMARMAKRAGDAVGSKRRIIGVSRFSDPAVRQRLEHWGVETIACDLLDEDAVAGLPDAPNVVFMAGFKFGATGAPGRTWAMNCYLPALVCRKFQHSQIVAFSSGNVYGMVPVAGGGSVESDPVNPVGEYAMTVLGRERMFEHFSETLDIPLVIVRLNYATEMRYGVLVDIADKVYRGEPIDLTMGHFNVIWQADAGAMALQALGHTAAPPLVVNVAGPEILSVREVAEQFGSLLTKDVRFIGSEAADALVSNGGKAFELFGRPSVSASQLIQWTARWVGRGGESLGKPTHFESRDGRY